jgi:serine/threonine-protein kinase
VHRDLKPANLFCIRRPDGVLSVKVLDFGISKMCGQLPTSSKSMTSTAAVMGSPFYMSPEQLLSSRNVDARTDIWSLGAILFELLTGRVPFDGESLPEISIKIGSLPTPRVRDYRPDVPAELELAIDKCLEKDRCARFPNIADLAIALAPFGPRRSRTSVERISGIIRCSGLSASVLALPPSSKEPELPLDTQGDWTRTLVNSRGARKGLMAVAATAVVVGAGLWLWPQGEDKSNVSTRTAGSSVVSRTLSAFPADAGFVQSTTPTATAEERVREGVPAKSQSKAFSVPSTALPAALGARRSTGRSSKRGIVSDESVVVPLAPSATEDSPPPTGEKTKANCDLPYTLDAKGRKHFKVECYVRQPK